MYQVYISIYMYPCIMCIYVLLPRYPGMLISATKHYIYSLCVHFKKIYNQYSESNNATPIIPAGIVLQNYNNLNFTVIFCSAKL